MPEIPQNKKSLRWFFEIINLAARDVNYRRI